MMDILIGFIIGCIIGLFLGIIEMRYYYPTDFGERHPFLVLNIMIAIIIVLILLGICL